MSFSEDQEDDWFANDYKGASSDYYAGELSPWLDHFADTSAQVHRSLPDPKRSESKKRRAIRMRAAEKVKVRQ